MFRIRLWLIPFALFGFATQVYAQDDDTVSQVVSEGGTDPEPTGNPSQWASSRDYPSSALRDDREGVTRFRLDIGINGRVAECTVTASSGFSDLDEKTCELMIERGIFQPASTQEGVAVPGIWSSAVLWRIPSGPEPGPQPFDNAIVIIVEADGSVSYCEATNSVNDMSKQPDQCEYFKDATFVPYENESGEPVRKRVTMKATVTLTDIP